MFGINFLVDTKIIFILKTSDLEEMREINTATIAYTTMAIRGSMKLASKDVAISAAMEPMVMPMV